MGLETALPPVAMRLDVGAVFVLLFALATAVAIAARRLRIPYTAALVVAGLALGALRVVNPPRLTQELLFALVLPGLVFEAAVNLRAKELWGNRLTLFLLALPGVAVATLITFMLTPLALRAFHSDAVLLTTDAFVFAALISATDPIAVLALFRELGAPRRLTLLVEGESLLNDATAIAFFLAAVAFASGGSGAPGRVADLAGHVVTALLGGAAIGIGVGAAVALVIARLDEPMIEITLTVIAAYGSFALAQQLGASGVLATVAAGLLCGADIVRRGMSATTRIAVGTFWEYGAFALNSIVFLLIGFEVQFGSLLAEWRAVLAAFVAVLLARVLVVGRMTIAVRPTGERLSWRWSAVLTWGGLRGALSMVLALGVPAALPGRGLLVTMTFGIVILSILGEGLTMPALLRRLGLASALGPERAFAVARERFRTARAAVEELDYLSDAGLVPEPVERNLRRRYIQRFTEAEGELRSAIMSVESASTSPVAGEIGAASPSGAFAVNAAPSPQAVVGGGGSLRAESSAITRRLEHYLLDVERDRLNDARHAGAISQDEYARMLADLDERRDAIDPESSATPAADP